MFDATYIKGGQSEGINIVTMSELTDDMDCEHELFKPSVDSFFKANIAPNLHLNRWQIENLKLATTDQSENEAWHEERYKRLTASRFHLVMSYDRRHEAYPIRALKEMFHVGTFHPRQREAANYGLQHEPIAAQLYVSLMESKGCPVTTERSGMYVMESNPWVSLDRW